jgi:hypothetical protein
MPHFLSDIQKFPHIEASIEMGRILQSEADDFDDIAMGDRSCFDMFVPPRKCSRVRNQKLDFNVRKHYRRSKQRSSSVCKSESPLSIAECAHPESCVNVFSGMANSSPLSIALQATLFSNLRFRSNPN